MLVTFQLIALGVMSLVVALMLAAWWLLRWAR